MPGSAAGAGADRRSGGGTRELTISLPAEAGEEEEAYLHGVGAAGLLRELSRDLLQDRPGGDELLDWVRGWASWRATVAGDGAASPGRGDGGKNKYELPFSGVQITGELGYGLFGRMYTVTRKGPTRRGSVAGRSLVIEEALPLLERAGDAGAIQRQRGERAVLEQLAAERVGFSRCELQRLVGLCVAPTMIYLLSDAPGYPVNCVTWLRSIRVKEQRLSMAQILGVALDVAEGVAAVHAEGMTHGAVSGLRVFRASPDTDDCILWDPGLWNEWWHVRLPVLYTTLQEQGAADGPAPKPNIRQQQLRTALRRYAPPEAQPKCVPTRAGDVWAFGLFLRHCFLYCEDDYPLQGVEDEDDLAPQLIAREADALFPQPTGCPDEVWYGVVAPCLRDASERPGITEVLGEVRRLRGGAEFECQDGPRRDAEQLIVPFPTDDLSFVQYNVPRVRRTMMQELNRQKAIAIDLSAVKRSASLSSEAEGSRTLSRTLEEVAKAITLTSHCQALRLAFPEGRGRGARGIGDAPQSPLSPKVMGSLKGFDAVPTLTDGVARPEAPPRAPGDERRASEVVPSTFRMLGEGLAESSSLRELAIDAIPLGAAGVEALAVMLRSSGTVRSLEVVNVALGDSSLGPTLCAHLISPGTVATVRSVTLCNVGAGDASAAVFAEGIRGGHPLEHLHLTQGEVTKVGAAALAEAVCTTVTLRTLDLFRNGVGDDGAEALADALRHNDSLDRVDLQFNGLTLTGATHVLSALELRPHISRYKTRGLVAFAPADAPEAVFARLLPAAADEASSPRRR